MEGGLFPSGQTYYDLAFTRAKGQLDAMSGADKRALIFLSDGAPNGGDYSYELGQIERAGIPVFAIGFASAPGSVLAEIAAETGGQAYTVRSAGEAQAVFARIISTLTCDATQVRADVTLQPNETRSFPYTIGPSDREFRALATWSFGGVNVRLVRPDKSALTPGTEQAGERFISEDTYASVTGTNPQVGGWALEVTASADNVEDVDVSIDVFRRTSADPPDAFALT
ncbi:MAG TPA: VWA domain-containing protein, partial [Solirubrobacter sp.]